MAERTYFVTGATGLLGTEVVMQLLSTTDNGIYVLVRGKSAADAENRLRALWSEVAHLSSSIGTRVKVVVGDITQEGLAADAETLTRLIAETTHVIHCAAETGVQKSREELWKINVEGTRHMLRMAEEMPRLTRFTYVSTAYVAGTQSGAILEDTPAGTEFYSLYEQSKAEAEKMVRASHLPITICRPGMIVGNSLTGRTRNFNTVYYVLKLLLLGKLRFLPISRAQTVNVVPVDYVAQQVTALSLMPESEGKTFHLTAPTAQLPKAGELVEEVREWAKENLQTDIPRPIYVPLPFLRLIGKRYNAGKEAKKRNILSNLTALMPYFIDEHEFDRNNTDNLTGKYEMEWRTFLPTLLDYACRHNFMRLSDNSIFEQAIARRKSRHYPITYYNISATQTEQISGDEINAIIGHYAGMLQDLGVNQGDKVALSGVNCAEHAAIDNAIGLIGATSVPIYYTSPAEEISLLLKKSGARIFFVGDERIKQNLGNVSELVKVVFFGPLQKQKIKSKTYEYTRVRALDLQSSVATIRYTSGTTGDPKGVMFSYSQLKWMGESLADLLSWKDRTSEMRYLSFLPMSHVVEGILAAYVPYCILCKAKIYYLNDFQMLQRALPQVRPTVFFSVPRFYEKLMEQIEHNPWANRYIRMNDGIMKREFGKLLRKMVLRKSGLDKCSQLIVGSAPVSEDLLHRFRSLGIEIHNAYGQTEAPLISINRMGDNVIPSIGTPLRATTVKVGSDGELIVRGPQVALGYYQMESATFGDGSLHTGDIGHVEPDGHIYISGRKRDMLITSYGKNINCSKIEQRLTDIAGVEHAVLVGDKRPYCTALLWYEGDDENLGKEIDRMNTTLSHPEQVKRWRVIKRPLSIKSGELTPNLKIKRDTVLSHFKQEIDTMYDSK